MSFEINPWSELPTNPPFVLKADAQAVAKFNKLATAKHEIKTAILPEPFLGNPEAPVVLLNLNPGWNAAEDSVNHSQWDFIKRNRQNLMHEKSEFPFYQLDPALLPYRTRWLDRRLNQLIEETNPKAVANGIFCAEYFPYHTKSFKEGCSVPSQRYTFDIVRRAVKRRAVILLMRSERFWTEAVPELATYSRLFKANSVQCAYVTSNNYRSSQRDGFFEALAAIKNGR